LKTHHQGAAKFVSCHALSACIQELRELMPTVLELHDEDEDLQRAVQGLPAPMNAWPLPPHIVFLERGECFEEVAARNTPNIQTSMQVRCRLMQAAQRLPACMMCAVV
jgi:hypothetical protein